MDKTQMVHIVVDGKNVEAAPGDTILQAAQKRGIVIPSVCHHDSLEHAGACRICVVEVHWPNLDKTDVKAACSTQVEEGIKVKTSSPVVLKNRRRSLDLMLEKAPTSPKLLRLSEQTGLESSVTLDDSQKNDCILCYKCTRVCKVQGCEAISPVGRGQNKKIAPPFEEPPESCIGCGACASICPVNCIEMRDTNTYRVIWKQKFEFVLCETCGHPIVTRSHMEHAVARAELDAGYFTTCAQCKQRQVLNTISKIGVTNG